MKVAEGALEGANKTDHSDKVWRSYRHFSDNRPLLVSIMIF